MRFQGDDPSCGDQGSEQRVRGAARPMGRPGLALGTGRFGGPSGGSSGRSSGAPSGGSFAVRPRRAGVTVLAAAL
ncbi:hypothetical protein, partial [Streptomyces huiliensis]|uniref:hypothetical protein n=1 Tax=Streptomyces huiliensis TaxID=2876027 RepID=UPI001CBDA197